MSEERLSDDLSKLVGDLEQDSALFEPGQLRRRIEAVDLLESCLVGDCPPDDGSKAAEICRRATDLRILMEAANERVYENIRAEIRQGQGRESLLYWARSEQDHEVGAAGGLGYGFLDELVSGVLRFGDPVSELITTDPEMVAYQPTPARLIFDLIEAANLTAEDVLIDLGSGLGHFPLLVSICTAARCIGIEVDPGYVEQARQCALSLNLSRVRFRPQDAREADLSSGTVFYLYTPFTGSILRSVLDRLRGEAGLRSIRICSYGPSTPVIAKEPWLEAAMLPTTHRIALFQSRM